VLGVVTSQFSAQGRKLPFDGRHVSSLGLSGTRSLAVKLGESGGFNYRVILPLGAS